MKLARLLLFINTQCLSTPLFINIIVYQHDLYYCLHNLELCLHNLEICLHNLEICKHDLDICKHNLVICKHNLVICKHNLLSRPVYQHALGLQTTHALTQKINGFIDLPLFCQRLQSY